MSGGPAHRSDLNARLCAGLDAAWAKGWATRPSLDPDTLIDLVRAKEGRAPADGEWRDRLDRLCRSLRQEAGLNAIGLTSAHVQLVKLLRARVRVDRYRQRHPDVPDVPVTAPLVIVGQMRSGTTRIHRLLACDEAFLVNRFYEQLDPVPYGRGWDRRPLSAAITGGLFRFLAPELAAIHPTAPNEAEEDFGLQAFSIWGALFEGQWRVPSFVAHLEASPAADAYAELGDLLRINAHHRGRDGTWLLKAPQFAQDLDALLAAFPDVRLVVLRRPNEELVASGASLVWNHSRVQSDEVTRHAVGREWLRKTRLRAERMEAALERHPQVPRVELDYADVSRDWRSAMAKVYALLGRPLDPETAGRMEDFLRRSTAHEGHRYALEDFGLDRATVGAAFA